MEKKSLKSNLTENGYTAIKLKFTKTKHFQLTAIINGIKGKFILDTGASNSCVGFNSVKTFNLNVEDSDVKAASAGAIDIPTQLSKKNVVKIGKWKKK